MLGAQLDPHRLFKTVLTQDPPSPSSLLLPIRRRMLTHNLLPALPNCNNLKGQGTHLEFTSPAAVYSKLYPPMCPCMPSHVPMRTPTVPLHALSCAPACPLMCHCKQSHMPMCTPPLLLPLQKELCHCKRTCVHICTTSA
eukprot:1158821-Pelagomonas_calceolata.AAC.4